MNDNLILEVTGQIDSRARLRHALNRQDDRIARAMEALGPTSGPFILTAEFTTELRLSDLSLVEACREVLTTVATISPLPVLTGIEGAAVRGSDEPSLTLRAHQSSDQPSSPAGMALLDERLSLKAGALGVGLSSDVRARPDAEYAISVDVPRRDDGWVDMLLSGLNLTRAVAYLLPSEPAQPSNLVQISVYMTGGDEETDSARVRVWRLGFMKVRSTTRTI